MANEAFFIAGQAGVVPVAMGCPGVAKTASCQSLAEKAGRPFVSFVLQHHMPEDFGGFPVVREIEHNGLMYEAMRRVPDEKLVRAFLTPSVVLFDELTNAGHAQQAAALQLIQEGIPGSWLFAAANPPELAAAGVDLTPPMVNRLCILEWEADSEGWDKGTRDGFCYEAPDVPVLPDNWRDWTTKWGRLMTEFRQRFPDLWCKPPKDAAEGSQPFPTPRAWTNVGLLLSAADSVDADSGVQANLVYGCVGQAAGSAFLSWLKSLDLPDPEALLSNPGSLSLPKRGDMAMAVVASVLDRIRANRTGSRWESGCDFLEAVYKQSQELAMAAEGGLWKLKPNGHTPALRNGVWSEIVKVRLGGAA